MVQLVQLRADYLLYLTEIDHPSRGRVGPAGNVDVHAIAVAVHPAALVAVRCVRQRVGRLKTKCLYQFRFHIRNR